MIEDYFTEVEMSNGNEANNKVGSADIE